MTYQLRADESVADGVRRLCAEQIDGSLAEIDGERDRHHAVHQVRKRCKKIRAVLRLAHADLARDDTYREENGWFRETARSLSYLRDAQALVETYDRLVSDSGGEAARPEFAAVRVELVKRRRRLADESEGLERRLGQVRSRMEAARERLARWPLDGRGWGALAPGVGRSYRRALKGLETAGREPSPEAFHEWRKRVKAHWYHCRLLVEIWPPVMAARQAEAHRLADLLGREHDLTVFCREVASFGEGPGDGVSGVDSGVGALLELAGRHQARLRAEALPLGRLLLAEKPKQLMRRLGVFWAVWREGTTTD